MQNIRRNSGFTLIELMIVVAIVAILAAIALPAYQDFMKRSKVSEAAATAGACKTSVAEFASAKGALPATIDEAGCSDTETQYVAAVDVTDGVISVTIQNVDSALDGSSLIFTPTSDAALATAAADGDTIVGWHCGTDAANSEYKLLPASCRQGAL